MIRLLRQPAPGWTGGQWSLLRILLAAGWWLSVGPWGAFSALPWLLGWTRIGGILGLVTLFGLQSERWDLYSVLLFSNLVPEHPFGAWSARGRLDPRGDWYFPNSAVLLAWLALLASFVFRSIHHGDNVALIPVVITLLAALPSARGAAWLALVGVSFLDLLNGEAGPRWLLHLATFAPQWVPGVPGAERLYYDGTCGLCHRAVRFILAEDTALKIAPLGGDTFLAQVPQEARTRLPDSLVLWADGKVWVEFPAVLRILYYLGGWWRLVGLALFWVPRPVGNWVYRGVAKVRHRWFDRPKDACPLLPPALRARFDP